MKGFAVPADALVSCSACGASEGEPCTSTTKKRELKKGHVHFGRRVRRLLLTAGARPDERAAIEEELLKLLRKEMKR